MANYTKRNERAAFFRPETSKTAPPPKRARAKRVPPPTLIAELRKPYGSRWMWFWCPVCNHRAPKALAPLAIRYGFDVPVIEVAKFGRCSACGPKGALLQRPSVQGTADDLMVEPFPDELDRTDLRASLHR